MPLRDTETSSSCFDHRQIDISIAPESIDNMAKYFTSENIAYEVVMADIGSVIAQQNAVHQSRPSNAQAGDFAYDKYHPLEEIHAWIDQMVQDYPSLASSFVVGKSYEKRDMKGLKISSSKVATKLDGTPVNKKKAVWWDGGEVLTVGFALDLFPIRRYPCSRMDQSSNEYLPCSRTSEQLHRRSNDHPAR